MLGNDDVKNTFCLIKNNPAAVSIHRFVGHDLLVLGFCMEYTFGNNYSPSNFDFALVVHSLWLNWLWEYEVNVCL